MDYDRWTAGSDVVSGGNYMKEAACTPVPERRTKICPELTVISGYKGSLSLQVACSHRSSPPFV
jgi:hypothetical protein